MTIFIRTTPTSTIANIESVYYSTITQWNRIILLNLIHQPGNWLSPFADLQRSICDWSLPHHFAIFTLSNCCHSSSHALIVGCLIVDLKSLFDTQRFKWYQQGSIWFKSGKFAGHETTVKPGILRSSFCCHALCAGAPSCTRKHSPYFSITSLQNEINRGRRIYVWYRYQSIPPLAFLLRSCSAPLGFGIRLRRRPLGWLACSARNCSW